MNRALFWAVVIAGLLGYSEAEAAYMGSAPLVVGNGGTGAVTFTAHGPLVGEGTSAVVAVSPVAGAVMYQSGTSSDPSMSVTPTLGVAGTTAGTLALASSATSNLITFQNVGATSAYNYNPPVTAGSSNQLETSGGGGSTANSWTNIASLLTPGTGITITGTTNATINSTSAPSFSRYTTSNATVTLASTNMQITGLDQTGTKATTVDLPASPSANTQVCLKDDGNGFSTNNPTVKTTDSSTVDHTTGTTGYVMPAQNYAANCFIYDSTDTNWDIN